MDPLDSFIVNQQRFIVVTILSIQDNTSQTIRITFYERPTPEQAKILERLTAIGGVSGLPSGDGLDFLFVVSFTMDAFGLGRAVAETLQKGGSNIRLLANNAEVEILTAIAPLQDAQPDAN